MKIRRSKGPKNQETDQPNELWERSAEVFRNKDGNDQEKITTEIDHEEPWGVELIKEPSEGRRARNQANQGTRRC
jgi:hypothetical protein